jgi:hypothetical protein
MKNKKRNGLKEYATYGVGLLFLQAMLSAYVTTPEWSLVIVVGIVIVGLLTHKL